MTTAVWAAIAAGAAALALRGVELWRAAGDRRRLAEAPLLRRMARPPGAGRRALRAALLAAGVAALTAALAGSGPAEAEPSRAVGGETILVLDASNSMLSRDVSPSRLERQKELARGLARELPGQVGVVYFAGRGYVLSPLTADRNAVLGFIEAVRPANVGRGGSDLAAGLEQAVDLLVGGREEARKSIVLFSDGEETVGRTVEEVAERAASSGIEVHAVGIGTARGAPIPLSRDAAVDSRGLLRRPGDRRPTSDFEQEYLRGPDGEVVVTKLEEAPLRRVAAVTRGVFLRGGDADVDGLGARLAALPVPPADPAGGGPLTLVLLGAFGLLWIEGFLVARG